MIKDVFGDKDMEKNWQMVKESLVNRDLVTVFDLNPASANQAHRDIDYAILQALLIWLLSFRGGDYLEIDQSVTRIACEMCNLYRGPSIDASYQVSVLLAEGFRRSTYGRFCIKFPQDAMEGERHRLSPLSL
jgi:hypothetical protein